MPTINASSVAVSITLGQSDSIVFASNPNAEGTITVTPFGQASDTSGVSIAPVTYKFGPPAFRKTIGPFYALASVTVLCTAGSIDYTVATNPTRAPLTIRPANLSRNLLATFVTNVVAAGGTFGTDLFQSTLDKVAPRLDALMRSTAWPKIRELWVPIGDTSSAAGLSTSLVKLKFPSGAAAALTNTALVAGDYTPLGGINTAAGAGKRLTSDFNPNTVGMAAGEQGFCGYVFGTGSRGSRNADQATAAAVTPYTGWVGCPMGASTNSNYFLPIDASKICRSNGGTVPTVGMGRMRAVQQTGGVTQAWIGALMHASVANAAPTANNSIVSIAASNTGDANNFSGSIGGYAFFDPLNASEMGDLADFFDNLNQDLSRPVFFEELLVGGDSNTFGAGNGPSPPTATQRWSFLAATEFGVAENNQGYGGAIVGLADPNWGQNGTLSKRAQRLWCTSARFNVIMFGTNDIARDIQLQGMLDYEAMIAGAKLARCPNLFVLGIGGVDWVKAKAFYAGTGYANSHSHAQVVEWNAATAAMCVRQNVPYFDISSIPNLLQSDGVHNTAASHAVIAPAVTAAMRQLLL